MVIITNIKIDQPIDIDITLISVTICSLIFFIKNCKQNPVKQYRTNGNQYCGLYLQEWKKKLKVEVNLKEIAKQL